MATPVISVDDIVVSEADTTASFTVNLSESIATTVTAVNGCDYVDTSDTPSFPHGQTALTIPVTLVNNAIAEPIETFRANLSSATDAVIDHRPQRVMRDN